MYDREKFQHLPIFVDSGHDTGRGIHGAAGIEAQLLLVGS